jgi:cytoskeleton protein RodZ
MSDDVENNEAESTESTAEGPRGGERLAHSRRKLQISVQEIAKELHLDEPKVRALERNEFDALGAPVFAKGHLRKYAELVNVSADDVIGDYDEMCRTADAPPVVSTRRKPRRELSPGPWIAVVVIVIAAATAYWWFTRPAPPPSPTVPAEMAETADVEVAVPAGSGAETMPAAPAEESDADVPVPADMPPEEEAEPDTASTSSPDIADGQMRMLLSYSGDCWTEVSDANGRRLFFKLGEDGRTVELSGAEPFNVLFGSPGNVSVLVNGEEYPLPASARPDRLLRMTISGS